MASEVKKNLKSILHPYMFILKEGGSIKSDLLDYSLMMLLVNSSETIKSPNKKNNIFEKPAAKLEVNLQMAPTILGNSK